jgi:hypothetical protein
MDLHEWGKIIEDEWIEDTKNAFTHRAERGFWPFTGKKNNPRDIPQWQHSTA